MVNRTQPLAYYTPQRVRELLEEEQTQFSVINLGNAQNTVDWYGVVRLLVRSRCDQQVAVFYERNWTLRLPQSPTTYTQMCHAGSVALVITAALRYRRREYITQIRRLIQLGHYEQVPAVDVTAYQSLVRPRDLDDMLFFRVGSQTFAHRQKYPGAIWTLDDLVQRYERCLPRYSSIYCRGWLIRRHRYGHDLTHTYDLSVLIELRKLSAATLPTDIIGLITEYAFECYKLPPWQVLVRDEIYRCGLWAEIRSVPWVHSDKTISAIAPTLSQLFFPTVWSVGPNDVLVGTRRK